MNIPRAFTLLEVLIVLVIVSVMASISIPYLKNFISSAQDESIRMQLMQTIERAQREAYLRRTEVLLCNCKDRKTCTDDTNAEQIVFLNEYQDGIIHEQSQILCVHKLKLHQGKLLMRSYPFYRKYIKFDPLRLNHVDNATFWFCHSSAENPSWAISINKMGRPRIIFPNNDGVIFDTKHKKLTCG